MMDQLNLLKSLLGDPPESDAVLQFYLDKAGDIICEIRHSNIVENKYKNIQVEMAIQLFNQRGAEGQDTHSENGINRGWEKAGISDTLLSKVTPYAHTPHTPVRVIE